VETNLDKLEGEAATHAAGAPRTNLDALHGGVVDKFHARLLRQVP